MKKADLLEGVAYPIIYRDIEILISLFPKVNPIEIFISSDEESDPLTNAGLSMTTRLLTMVLAKYPINEIVTQLERSSLCMRSMDMPGIFAKLLTGYRLENGIWTKEE
ncbi:MAG: hypothetical protein GY820_39235 [Gammaproteobacteria bacterium]|nr:hypothetical protein [Gammaproteobacteria bacterium]